MVKRVWAAIDRFFFADSDLRILAFFRCALGLHYAVTFASWWDARALWFFREGLVRPETAVLMTRRPVALWIDLWPTSDAGVSALLVGGFILSVALSMGLFSRLAALLLFVMIQVIQARAGFVFNAGDNLAKSFLFLLVFSRAGNVFSVDRLWRPCLPRVGPAWPWRLMQIQVTIMYLSTFLWKITSPEWRSGAFIFMPLQTDLYRAIPFPWMENVVWLRTVTRSTLMFELALPLGLWSPSIPVRAVFLVLGVLFHFSIFLFFYLPQFQTLMMIALPLLFWPRGRFDQGGDSSMSPPRFKAM